MKQVLLDFLSDTLDKIFGTKPPRTGKLILSTTAKIRMNEYQLDIPTLEDTFRYGEETTKGNKVEIIRKYQNYSVGLWCVELYEPIHKNVKPEKRYMIIACWKR